MVRIELCFLSSYPSLYEGIKCLTGAGRNQAKKFLSTKECSKSIIEKKTYALPIDLVNFLMINPVCSNHKIKIISENDDFIFLSKPARCHTHPLKYTDQNNILSYLRQAGKGNDLKINETSYDRGLLYRLDYETSGLIIYCRRSALYHELRENFTGLVKEKTYYAIVRGKIASSTLVHKLIYTSQKSSKARALDVSSDIGITASIEVQAIEHRRDADLSLVKIVLSEGHRHQIRVQLAAIGHPILGDSLYGDQELQQSSMAVKRMYLHCYTYCVNGLRVADSSLDDFKEHFDI